MNTRDAEFFELRMVMEDESRKRRSRAAIITMPSRESRARLVYFIRSGDRVKIGVARNPRDRLHSLQVGNTEELELLATIHGGRAREKMLHRRFAELAIRGEWFKLEGDLLDYIEELKAQPTP